MTELVIKPPTTTKDDGSPSDDVWDDANRIFAFIDDERHLAALGLYKSVAERLAGMKEKLEGSNSSTTKSKSKSSKRSDKKAELERQRKLLKIQKVDRLFQKKAAVLTKLEKHCKLFESAKRSLGRNEDWTLAQTLFGITTYYRREDDGSLSIKLEGKLDGVPLFEQVAVLREVDLHFKWAPFCSSSLTVTHLDKLDTVGWFMVGVPNFGLARDGCFRAIGCDSINEDGSILLVGQGLADRPEPAQKGNSATATAATDTNESEQPYSLRDDDIVKNLDLPPVPTRMGSGRMTIRIFQAMIEVTSPTSATSKLIANIDPNLSFLPQGLLDFLMKKLCGVLLHKLQGAAKRVAKDPVANPHAMKMRQEQAFYKDWLMVKFQDICELRGWQMPPVPAFELDATQQVQALKAEEKAMSGGRRRFMHTRSAETITNPGKVPKVPSESAISTPSNFQRDRHMTSAFRQNSVDSDTISELSLNSSSTASSLWRNNPISTYLREIEEKVQLRKALDIAQSRQMAADRLRPKQLQKNQQARLAELRAAKGTATPSNGVLSRGFSLEASATTDGGGERRSTPNGDGTATIEPQNRFTKWSDHTMPTRVATMTILFVALFGSLSMGSSVGSFLFHNNERRWYIAAAKDVATVLYMTVSAGIHFGLCYVALMYSFSALHIGKIAGMKAKKFYSENVHLLVASTSAAMVVMSLVKTAARFSLRQLTWYSILSRKIPALLSNYLNPWNYEVVGTLWGRFLGETSAGKVLGTSVLPAIGTVVGTVQSFGLAIVVFMSTIGSMLNRLFVQSNIVGRILSSSISRCVGMVQSTIQGWLAYEDDVVAIMQHRIAVQSWREDAFRTTSQFLTYSATFLIVLLFVFTLSARYARFAEEEEGAPTNKPATGSFKQNIAAAAAATNTNKGGISSPKQQTTTALSNRVIGTINETEVYTESPSVVQSTSGSVGTSRRRRRYVISGPSSRRKKKT